MVTHMLKILSGQVGLEALCCHFIFEQEKMRLGVEKDLVQLVLRLMKDAVVQKVI